MAYELVLMQGNFDTILYVHVCMYVAYVGSVESLREQNLGKR
jgi:hypothetical protein